MQDPATACMALTFGVAAFVIVVFWTSFGSMWALWQTTDHRLGLLVFPISAFLVWRLRYRIVGLPMRVDVRGLVLAAVIAALWVVARVGGLQVVEHLAVLALIPAAVFALAGPQLTRILLFPLLFLLMAAPIGDALVPYLMVATADIATALLKLSGIPVLRNGQYLSLPGGEFVIADVCGGLRYVSTGLMISLLFGYLSYSSPLKRAVLALLTVLTMIVTNGVRVYVVTSVASATHMQYFGGRDHVVFGWILFGLVTTFIMVIAVRYADTGEQGEVESGSATASSAPRVPVAFILALGLMMLAITIKPLQAEVGKLATVVSAGIALIVFIYLLAGRPERYRPGGSNAPGFSRSRIRVGQLTFAAATLLFFIAASRYVDWLQDTATQARLDDNFSRSIPCDSAGAWTNSWRPDFGSPDTEYALRYRCTGGAVNVYSAGYATASQDDELISSSHHPMPSDWGDRESATRYALAAKVGEQVEVVESIRGPESSGNLVWYWYEVDGRVASRPLKVKILQILAALKRRPAGGRVFVVETDIDGDAAAARARLRRVAEAIIAQSAEASRGEAS